MSPAHRPFVRLVVTALLLGALTATAPVAAIASSTSQRLEACQSCEGCEDGGCDDLSPLGAEHCCPSSCLAHAVWTLTAPPVPPAPSRCEDAEPQDQDSPLRPAPEGIFEPPRR